MWPIQLDFLNILNFTSIFPGWPSASPHFYSKFDDRIIGQKARENTRFFCMRITAFPRGLKKTPQIGSSFWELISRRLHFYKENEHRITLGLAQSSLYDVKTYFCRAPEAKSTISTRKMNTSQQVLIEPAKLGQRSLTEAQIWAWTKQNSLILILNVTNLARFPKNLQFY